MWVDKFVDRALYQNIYVYTTNYYTVITSLKKKELSLGSVDAKVNFAQK